MSDDLVLVTGGSGFLAAHTIVAALRAGHRVRTTVRSMAREAEVRDLIREGGQDASGVEILSADLLQDTGWAEAMAGVDHVLHLASPFPSTPPKDPQELIRPAREGALRVLGAAHAAGVRRVVMTSSFAAVGYGHRPGARPFTEADWTDPDAAGVRAYVQSKTLAERAAWDFARAHQGFELVTILPVAIFGPLLGRDMPSSLELVRRLMNGSLPGVPRLAFGVVDVRDVADLHLRAMTAPQAAGRRYLAVSGDFMTLGQVAGTLRHRLGSQASRVPTRRLPDALVRAAGLFSPAIRDFTPELGHLRQASAQRALDELDWHPRPREETLVDTGRSLIAHGLV